MGLTTKSYANAKERRAFMMCATTRIPNSHLHTFKVFNLGRVSKTPVEKVSGNFLMEKGVTNLAILEATKRQEKPYAKRG